MALLEPETILRRIITIYEDDYATSLATVQAKWAATEDITLDDFVTRQISANPDVLPKVWQSPAFQAGMGTLRQIPDEGTLQQFHTWYALDLRLYYYFKNPDSRSLALIIARNEEATLDLFINHPDLDFGSQGQIVKNTTQFVPSAASPFGTNTLAQGLLVQFGIRFMQYGI